MDDDKWIKDLERKMEGFEVSPPKDLWNDIEHRLAQRNGQVPPNPAEQETAGKPRVVGMRRRGVWMAAAVFAACLVVGSSVWLANRHPETPLTYTELAKVPESSQQNVTEESEQTVPVTDETYEPSAVSPVASRKTVATPVDVEGEKTDNGEIVPKTVKQEQSDSTDKETKQPSHSQPNRPDRKKGIVDVSPWGGSLLASNRSKEEGFSVSLVAQGIMSSKMEHAGYGELLAGSIWQSGSDDGVKGDGSGSDEFGILEEVIVGNGDRAVYTKKSHRQPVRIGASVSWNLGMGWSVGTGLTYSYLSSDLMSGTAESHYSTHQKLHYVGIPLNVGYAFFSHRRLSLYGTVGGMVEKCVKGESSTVFAIGGKEESVQYDDVSEKRLQYSANASLGVSIDIADHVGFYLEPGVSYHFNNHSGVTNIYKDTPLNFSLGLGFRYSF